MAKIKHTKDGVIKREIKNQLSSLILNGRLTTTMTRAKKLKIEFERLSGKLSENNSLNQIRMTNLFLTATASKRLRGCLKNRISVIRTSPRQGDGAEMAIVISTQQKQEDSTETDNQPLIKSKTGKNPKAIK